MKHGNIIISQPTALYIHIPFCERKCFYCDFYSEPLKNHDVPKTLGAMLAEFDRYKFESPAKTIYIGGGSPSCLLAENLLHFIDEITRRTGKAKEFTIEVNPGQTNPALLNKLYAAGVNRLSIGAQSLCKKDIEFLRRDYQSATVTRLVNAAKKAGFDNISIDLIFAVPGSNLRRWKRGLQKAVSMNIDHISAYALSYEHGTALTKMRDAGLVKPVSENLDRQMYEAVIDMLAAAGFEHYEISNFAKPHKQCRHNLTYWNNEEYIGIGPSATSHLQRRRITNIRDIHDYCKAVEAGKAPVEECIESDERNFACETAVLGLRKICGLNLAKFHERTGFDALKMFAEPVKKYRQLNLIEVSNGRLKLTRAALPIANSILCDFAGAD